MIFTELKPGRSVEGDKVHAYRTEGKYKKYIYLIAGVHGDEPEGIYVLDKIFSWLKEHDELDIPLIIIPVLNVDGHRAQTRVNTNGVDLNRNLPSKFWTREARAEKYFPGRAPLSEPENQFLDKILTKYPPSQFISFHSWKPFINYNGDCSKIAEFLARYNKYEVCANIEGHPTPGSLGEYGPEKYNCPVLTFEFPEHTQMPLKDIWEENKTGLIALFESDLL